MKSDNNNTTNIRKILLIILRFCISFGILYYLLTKISFSEAIDSISSANLVFLSAGYLVQIVMPYVAAYRLKILLDWQGVFLSVLDITSVSFSTIFYKLFIPGGMITGGLIRWYKLSKPNNKPAQVMAAVIFDRIVNTIALCALGVLFWLLDRPSDQGYIGLGLGTVLGGFCAFYALISTNNILTAKLSGEHVVDFPLIPNIILRKFRKFVVSLNQYEHLSYNHVSAILAISVASHLVGIISGYLLALSLDMNISLISIAWIRTARKIILMVPISFKGFGVREATLVFLLGLYGVSSVDAVAYSLIIFGGELCMGAIGGLVEVKEFFWPAKRGAKRNLKGGESG